MPSSDKDMLYWLDKIDETERKLLMVRKLLMQYNRFIETLSDREKVFVRNKCEIDKLIDEQINMEKNDFKYKSLNKVIRLWIDFEKRI
jgi:hypothetical protein